MLLKRLHRLLPVWKKISSQRHYILSTYYFHSLIPNATIQTTQLRQQWKLHQSSTMNATRLQKKHAHANTHTHTHTQKPHLFIGYACRYIKRYQATPSLINKYSSIIVSEAQVSPLLLRSFHRLSFIFLTYINIHRRTFILPSFSLFLDRCFWLF